MLYFVLVGLNGKKQSINDSQYKQYFSRRKPNSYWSKINKEKITFLESSNLLRPAGASVVEEAKLNGSWSKLDDVEALIIPEDLLLELKKYQGAEQFFLSLTKSKKKATLQWIVFAKKRETRIARINKVALKSSLKEYAI